MFEVADSYMGLRLFTIPDGIFAVPPWKLKVFPKVWHSYLRPEWIPNPDCPPDGEVLMSKVTNAAFMNVRTYHQLKEKARELARFN